MPHVGGHLGRALVGRSRSAPAGGAGGVDKLTRQLDLELVSFDAVQTAIAREAFQCFGKGRHPARLNLGDCFAYALARHLDEPLLFKGDDFARSDIRSALAD